MLLFSFVGALEESGGPSPNLFGISFGQGEEDTEGELTITLKGASDEDLMALHRWDSSFQILVLIFPGGQKPNEPSLRRREKTQSVLLWPDFRTRAFSPSCRLQAQLPRKSPAVLSSWKMQIKHFFQLLLEGIPLRVFRPRHS